jgi:hypothetical protein
MVINSFTFFPAKGRVDMTCSLVFGAPCQLQSLAGQEHGRTIPLAEATVTSGLLTSPR